MSKGIYVFLPLSDDLSSLNFRFELYENGTFLVSFSRSSFRSALESLGRGSNWIGSILRLFLKKYPYEPPCPMQQRSQLDRIGEGVLVDYLRSKGFRVVKNLKVLDREVIAYLEQNGYLVEGLLNDAYYRSLCVLDFGTVENKGG